METFDRRLDKKTLIGKVRDAAHIAEAVKLDFPDFGLLYDLSHMPLLDEVPAEMGVIREHPIHIQVENCVKVAGRPLYGDQHPHFGFEGGEVGVEELTEFIHELFKIGYLSDGKEPKPCVGFEVKPHGPIQTPALIIATSKRAWRQAWAKV